MLRYITLLHLNRPTYLQIKFISIKVLPPAYLDNHIDNPFSCMYNLKFVIAAKLY